MVNKHTKPLHTHCLFSEEWGELERGRKFGHHLKVLLRNWLARKALYQVFNKQLSIRKAAREHNISYSSLQRRTSGLVDVEKKRGPETIFNKSEEETMAKYLSEMAQRGMGLRPTEFLDFVENIMKNDKRRKTFKDGRPSWD